MQKYGVEMLTETARFWASRLEKTERGYELTGVSGPDEMHAKCNNNSYTNYLVKAHLQWALSLGAPTDEEKNKWQEMTENIVIHTPNNEGIVEQFDGYFGLKEIQEHMEDPASYKAIKQTDVLVLPLLFPDIFSSKEVEAMYHYYLPRTEHGSNLSKSNYALVAAQIGLSQEGYDMFTQCLYMTLRGECNVKSGGVQAVNAAMCPRVLMEGFAGISVDKGFPKLTPHLPEAWKGLAFQFEYHGIRYFASIKRLEDGNYSSKIEEVLI